MNGYPNCNDCGFDFPAEVHARAIVLRDRKGAFVLCSRCFLKRDPSERGDRVPATPSESAT